jgi:hypothetical protein
MPGAGQLTLGDTQSALGVSLPPRSGGEGTGGGSFGNARQDRFDDTVAIMHDLMVPKAQNSIAHCRQAGSALGVRTKATRSSVLVAIKLDYQPECVMDEIRHMWTDRHLSAKMPWAQIKQP